MPNKHRLTKLRTKLLASGKLKEDNNVKSALSYLEKKIQMDNEDIDFDYEKGGKNSDFEEVDDADAKSKVKVKNNKKATKRKVNDTISEELLTTDETKSKSDPTEPQIAIPKKSKKNKYFFLAHPEVLTQTQKQINSQKISNVKNKTIGDTKKNKMNKKGEKLKKGDKQAKEKKEKKAKIKSNKIWSIEECDDFSSESNGNEETNENDANYTLDLADIEKNFVIKKKIKTLEDGTKIEVFEPEIVQVKESKKGEDSHEEEEEEDEKEENNEEMNDGEDDEEDHEDESHTKNIPNEITTVESKETKSLLNSNKKNKDLNKDKMLDQLKSSRFRFLNEMLYTQPSSESFEYFKKDSDSFTAYHEGYRNQIQKWPMNPLEEIIKYIKKRPTNLVVADFGCGEAKLAQSIENKVHSFDFIAANDRVVPCDMKNVPLKAQTIDIAVFSLSLMGTNITEFLAEAHRVLRTKGILKIAEVASRIQDKNAFIKSVEKIGFKLVSNQNEIAPKNANGYFYMLDFIKICNEVRARPKIELLPCLYKKR